MNINRNKEIKKINKKIINKQKKESKINKS